MNDEHMVKKYQVRFILGSQIYERFIEANTWKQDDRDNLHVVYQGDTILLLASGTWLSIERKIEER